MKIRMMAAVLASLTLATSQALWATTAGDSGSLVVSVTDNYGVLPGTVVRLVSKDGQTSQRAVTDGSGIARFSPLAAGEYTVTSSLAGFADAERTGITVGDTEEKVDLVMSLTRFSTTVTVTTANRREELLLNTAEPTTVIDRSSRASFRFGALGHASTPSRSASSIARNSFPVPVSPGV